MRKNLILLISFSALLILVLGGGLLFMQSERVAPQAATADPTLSLSPQTGTYGVGSTFNIELTVDTAGHVADGVDIFSLKYPKDKIEVQTISPAATFQVSVLNQSEGVVSLVGTVPQGSAGYNGAGTIATINFKALSQGTANVNFDFTPGSTRDCNIAEHGTYLDILTAVSNGTYTINTTTPPVQDTPPPPVTPNPPTQSPATGTTSTNTSSGSGTSGGTATTKSTAPKTGTSTTVNTAPTTNTNRTVINSTPTATPAPIKVGGFNANTSIGYLFYFLIPSLVVIIAYLLWKQIRGTKNATSDEEI